MRGSVRGGCFSLGGYKLRGCLYYFFRNGRVVIVDGVE